MNRLYEGGEFELPLRLATILNSLAMTLIFCGGLPVLLPLAMISLTVSFVVVVVLLLLSSTIHAISEKRKKKKQMKKKFLNTRQHGVHSPHVSNDGRSTTCEKKESTIKYIVKLNVQ